MLERLKPREVWRGRSPSITNPQQRHVRCGVLSARKMCRWHIFSEERAGRPWARIFAKRSIPGPSGPLLGEEEPQALPPGPPNPREIKNSFFADLPPGSPERARGKSEGVSARGTCPPRDAIQPRSLSAPGLRCGCQPRMSFNSTACRRRRIRWHPACFHPRR